MPLPPLYGEGGRASDRVGRARRSTRRRQGEHYAFRHERVFPTRTEREVATERPDAWHLHDLSAVPALFRLKPPLEVAVTLTAETSRVKF